MLAVVLALGAAFGWGTSDFLGGLKSRKIPVPSVMLVSQMTALGLLTVAVAVRGEGPPGGSSIAAAAGAGLAEAVAIAALYRGLAVGTMSIVAPVAALAPVVPLLAGLALGEVPGAVQFAGLGLASLGVIATSWSPGGEVTGARAAPSVLYGLLAASGLGVFFLAMDSASEGDVGWALLTARLTAVTALAALVVVRRRGLAVSRRDVPYLALVGMLIVMADTLYALASTQGLMSIAAVLSSLHTVVTIVLAWIFLRERLSRPQQFGIAAALAGVLAISAG